MPALSDDEAIGVAPVTEEEHEAVDRLAAHLAAITAWGQRGWAIVAVERKRCQ